MRWGLVSALALLSVAPQATPTAGPAPLHVSFAANGAASAHWDFGDGSAGDGVAVGHTYAAGRWTATMTAQAGDGTTSTQTVPITAYGLRSETVVVRGSGAWVVSAVSGGGGQPATIR